MAGKKTRGKYTKALKRRDLEREALRRAGLDKKIAEKLEKESGTGSGGGHAPGSGFDLGGGGHLNPSGHEAPQAAPSGAPPPQLPNGSGQRDTTETPKPDLERYQGLTDLIHSAGNSIPELILDLFGLEEKCEAKPLSRREARMLARSTDNYLRDKYGEGNYGRKTGKGLFGEYLLSFIGKVKKIKKVTNGGAPKS